MDTVARGYGLTAAPAEPRYSVIIPLYNKAPHIGRAIRSAALQEGPSFEILVIDDGSTDGGRAIAEAMAAEDLRIRFYARGIPGPGGYAARNFGARESRAEWLAFLDADDEWLPGFLAELDLVRARFPEAGFISGSYNICEGDGAPRLNGFAARRRGLPSSLVEPERFFSEASRGRWPTHTSSSAIRRSVFKDIGGFPEGRCARGGDRDTWIRAAMATPYAWTPFVGAAYHKDSVNMVTKTIVHPREPCSGRTIAGILARNASEALPPSIRRSLEMLHRSSYRSFFLQEARAGRLDTRRFLALYLLHSPAFAFRVVLLVIATRLGLIDGVSR